MESSEFQKPTEQSKDQMATFETITSPYLNESQMSKIYRNEQAILDGLSKQANPYDTVQICVDGESIKIQCHFLASYTTFGCKEDRELLDKLAGYVPEERKEFMPYVAHMHEKNLIPVFLRCGDDLYLVCALKWGLKLISFEQYKKSYDYEASEFYSNADNVFELT